MNVTNLHGNAASLPGQGSRERSESNLQCQPSNFAFELIAPPFNDLHFEGNKGVIWFSYTNSIVLMPDQPILYVPSQELASRNQSFMNGIDYPRPFQGISNVG